jgi:hypothetical protein
MSTQIIIKKLNKLLDQSPLCSLLIGDVQTQMVSDLLKSLTQVIDKKSDYKGVYWLLVATHKDPARKDTIKERIIILPERPKQRYLGSILIRVDNEHADAEIESILPLDIKIPGFIQMTPGKIHEQVGVKGIRESAKGMPIIHGAN